MTYKEVIEQLKTAVKKQDIETVVKLFTPDNAAVLKEGEIEVRKRKDMFSNLKEFFPALKTLSNEEMLTHFSDPMTEDEITKKAKELNLIT